MIIRSPLLANLWKKIGLQKLLQNVKCHRIHCQEVSSFFKTIFFHFIKQICLGAAQIDDLGTSVSVLLLYRALFTVVSVRDPWSSTDHTAALQSKGMNGTFCPLSVLFGPLTRCF